MSDLPSFSSSLHGFQCGRGELWLSDEECAALSKYLSSYGFCFVLPVTPAASPSSGPVTKRRKTGGGVSSEFINNTSTDGEKNAEPSSQPRGANVSRSKDLSSRRSSVVSTSSSRQPSGAGSGHADPLPTAASLKSSRNVAASSATSGHSITQRADTSVSVHGSDRSNHDTAHHPKPKKATSSKSVSVGAHREESSISTPATLPVTESATIPVPSSSSVRTNQRSSVPVRVTRRRRREVLAGDWVEACLQVTELLEKEPSSHWFLTPVDPNSKFLHDYLEKVSCPMDLQTVRQKLTHRMYSHPFRWQEDIRTIFYNAFTYHEPGNLIWSNACFLAGLFERLCREHEGVNPYAVYGTPPALSSKRRSEQKYTASPSRTATMSGSGSGNFTAAGGSGDQGHLTAAGEIKPGSLSNSIANHGKANTFSRSDTIVLEASKLRELLEKAATAAQQGVLKEGGLGKDTRFEGLEKHRGRAELGVGSGKGIIRYEDAPQFSSVSRSSGSRHSPKQPSASSSPSSSLGDGPSRTRGVPSLPPPTLPIPPPPPLITTMRPGDKIPNIIHRRLVSTQFRQLDVHLRKAALELVKDELGINPTTAACDVDFKVDLEILSFLKQKQFLTYLRTLDMFQRKRVEEGYTATVVTQLNPHSSRKVVHHASTNRPSTVYNANTHHMNAAAVGTDHGTVPSNRASVHSFDGSRAPLGSSVVAEAPTVEMDPSDGRHTSSSSIKSSGTSDGLSHPVMFIPTSSQRDANERSESSSSSSSTFSSSSSSYSSNNDDDDDDSSTSFSSSDPERHSDDDHDDINNDLSNARATITPSVTRPTTFSEAPSSLPSTVVADTYQPHLPSNHTTLQKTYTPFTEGDDHKTKTNKVSGDAHNPYTDSAGRIPSCITESSVLAGSSSSSLLPPLNSDDGPVCSFAADSTDGYRRPGSSERQPPRFSTRCSDSPQSIQQSIHETSSSLQTPIESGDYVTDGTPFEDSGMLPSRVSPNQVFSDYVSETISGALTAAELNNENTACDMNMEPDTIAGSIPTYSYSNNAHSSAVDDSSSAHDDFLPWKEAMSSSGSVASAWGEWKAKVIQQKIQARIGDEENQAFLATGDPEGERAAELADAEI